MNNTRKIFNYNNLHQSKIIDVKDKDNMYENSITACGCFIYKELPDACRKVLLIKYADPNWPLLDDFGGRVDINDNTIYDTIVRETLEETNNIINIRNLLQNKENKIHYNKTSKYLTIMIEVDDDFYSDTTIFSDYELHDKIKRTIAWYDYDNIAHIISHRIRNIKF